LGLAGDVMHGTQRQKSIRLATLELVAAGCAGLIIVEDSTKEKRRTADGRCGFSSICREDASSL